MLAPICLFTYNRLQETIKTVEALQANYLAKESILYIFSDGPKNEGDENVTAVRKYIKSIHGFLETVIIESPTNSGLAKSIIQGVSKIISKHGKAIVLEDDLITSRNFLDFMNQALDYYENSNHVFAISGFSYTLKYPKDYTFDAAFGLRSYSWGWATWKDKWETVDWEVKSYDAFIKDRQEKKDFAKGGSDLPSMLHKQMNHNINSWMIRWVYQQYRNKQLDVFPVSSKVINIGFSEDATHTNCSSLRYRTELDDSGNRVFKFSDEVQPNTYIIKQFQRKISILRRIKYKILDFFGISKFITRIKS